MPSSLGQCRRSDTFKSLLETWALIAAVRIAAASSVVSAGMYPLNLCPGLSLHLQPILSGVHLVFLMPVMWFHRLRGVLHMATHVLACNCSAAAGGDGWVEQGAGSLPGFRSLPGWASLKWCGCKQNSSRWLQAGTQSFRQTSVRTSKFSVVARTVRSVW